MAASKADIRRWFEDGVAIHATHLIVVCDTFSYDDYPVYVMPGEDVFRVEARHQLKAGNMQKVMEVYKMSLDKEQQLRSDQLVFNY